MTGQRRHGRRPSAARRPGGSRSAPVRWRRISTWLRAEVDAAAIVAGGHTVLEQHGLIFAGDALHGEELDALAAAGLAIEQSPPDRVQVRFPRSISGQATAGAPAAIAVASGVPGRHVTISGAADRPLLAPAATADALWSGTAERHAMTPDAVRDASALADALACLDVGAAGLWLSCPGLTWRQRALGFAACSRKPLLAWLDGDARSGAIIAAAQAARRPAMGSGEAALIGVVPVDRALIVDRQVVGAIRDLARSGEATVIAPTLLLGANCPATPAAALVQFAAGVSGLTAFCRTLWPEARLIAGIRVAEASLRNGLPMPATAASLRTLAGAIAVARHLGLPAAALGPATAAKGVDAEAAADTARWLAVACEADLVVGAVGALELDAGLSLEKMVLDADIVTALLAGADRGEDPIAAAHAIATAGADAISLATPATQAAIARQQEMLLPDDTLYETWAAAGRPDAAGRAGFALAELLMAAGAAASPQDAATIARIEAALDTSLAASPPARTQSPVRLADIASSLYSAAMRDAFGFKG